MNTLDLLKIEKELLLKELKETKASTRKEELIDRVLEIEKERLRILWEESNSDPSKVTALA